MPTVAQSRAAVEGIGAEARAVLLDGRAAHVRYEPGNMTGYELLITPWEAVDTVGARALFCGDSPGWVTVARFGREGGTHGVRLWELDGSPRCPDADYCAEKWAQGHIVDGSAIHLLLCAVAGCEPTCTFTDAHVTLR